MVEKLEEEKIEEIREAWQAAEDPSYTGIGNEVGVAKDTVKKYVSDLEPDDEDEGISQGGVPSMAASDAGSGLFPDPGKEMADAFSDFFDALNDQFGLGIKEKAIEMMAGSVKNAGQLPQPNNVAGFLERADSSVKNPEEIRWIAEQYGLWLQKYQSTQANSMGGGGPQAGLFGTTGGGQGVFGQQGGQQQGPMGMGQQQGGMQPGGAVGQGGATMVMLQQMQQQMQALQQRLEGGGTEQGEEFLESKTREFLEHKFTELLEADNEAEQQAIVQEISKLRREMQDSEGPTPSALGEDWRQNLIELTRSGDMDPEDAKELLETVGEAETNPAVLEKKYEKQIEEQRLDHETKRYETLGNALESAAERIGEGIGKSITAPGAAEDTGSESTEASDEQTASSDGGTQAAAPGEPVEAGDCPKCEATMYKTVDGTHCPECQYGIGRCDQCQEPLEVPPVGEAEFGFCPSCESPVPRADPDCDACEWSGEAGELGAKTLPNGIRAFEAVECESCEEVRPIARAGAPAAAASTDPDELIPDGPLQGD